MNRWHDHAEELRDAYVRVSSDVDGLRFRLVTRALLPELSRDSSVADVGGGAATQAISLARHGHRVTVIDADAAMIDLGLEAVVGESASVRNSISFKLRDGVAYAASCDKKYDAVCCHSVLMYIQEPEELIRALVSLCKPGGIISILTINQECIAMRSGLQGDWDQCLSLLTGHVSTLDPGETYRPFQAHTPNQIAGYLASQGVETLGWHGVGVFTDHEVVEVAPGAREELLEAEWAAGQNDPYRNVARCFHLIGRK